MIADGWIRLGDHVDEWGAAIPAGMPAADLTGHMALLGTTNSGKSTFLRNLILQYYGLGGTVVLLEPHGDLLFDAEEGILAALDRRQLAGVQLIDVEQEAAGWPISINLVGSGLVDGRERAVQQAMRAIHAMEPANWEMAVRMSVV